MSTLKVDNLLNAAGNQSPISVPGAAKAWVDFNGRGTVAIRDSFNVSSITDNGTGDYTVNFSSNMPDTNYCVSGTVADLASGSGHRWLSIGSGSYGAFAKSASSIRVHTVWDASNKLDADHVFVVIHGN
tara:strand:+ start:775 stop:1161 length:387 start_codon:yes stop_codon:yes gene_type:complete